MTLTDILSSFVDRDMFMRHRGGGIGHRGSIFNMIPAYVVEFEERPEPSGGQLEDYTLDTDDSEVDDEEEEEDGDDDGYGSM